ncbi:hypothetical protein ACJZ2D_003744 [Fusarium nematophilum]
MSPPTPPRTYFITLPCELRHQIYQDYFRLDGGYVHNSNDPFNGKLTSPNGQPIHLSLIVGDHFQDESTREELQKWWGRPWSSHYRVFNAYQKEEYEKARRRYRQKVHFSTAAVAIRLLDCFPAQRLNLRRIVLHEDHVSVGNAARHTQGMVRFRQENSQLRVTRRVSLWGNIFQQGQMPTVKNLAALEDGIRTQGGGYRLTACCFMLTVVEWLSEALASMEDGMPAGSFAFILDGEPALALSLGIFRRVTRMIFPANERSWNAVFPDLLP